MFGLFKKKPAANYPDESSWSVSEGKHNGHPMFLRRNDSAVALAQHPDFCFRVGVAVPLNAPDENGLPGGEEMGQLNAIEDALSSRLELDQQSLQVLTITTNGMREFMFYTRSPDAAQQSINDVKAGTSSHEVQSYIAEDIEWAGYKQFT